jgi:hypothetical protein
VFREALMTEERLKTWLGFVQFILGSVGVALVTLAVNNKIQERELEIKEQEQIGRFLEHALSEEVGVRRRFAQYFAAVTRSDTLRARWSVYLTGVNTEYDETEARLSRKQKEVEQLEEETQRTNSQEIELRRKKAEIEALEAALQPTPVAQHSLPPARIYFHITHESQRGAAQELARKATSELAVVVPGIERLDKGPKDAELRYFKVAEEAEARGITDFLNQKGLSAQLTYVPGFETTRRIRPRHYELWVSEEDLQNIGSGR